MQHQVPIKRCGPKIMVKHSIGVIRKMIWLLCYKLVFVFVGFTDTVRMWKAQHANESNTFLVFVLFDSILLHAHGQQIQNA